MEEGDGVRQAGMAGGSRRENGHIFSRRRKRSERALGKC